MDIWKCISLVWLARADLSNLNSGEGSGNLTELKTYDHGRKPYISGQATRTAIFETMARSHPDKFQCTAELPCTDVAGCWGCDLRGFLATEEDVGGQRRWSPLKVSPGLGQIPGEIVTDLLTRSSVVEKEGRGSKDMRIAHVQMMNNIYRFGLVIDVANVGLVRVPRLEGKGKEQRFAGWDIAVNISDAERAQRVRAVLDAVFNLSGFAKQARAAVSLSPDIILIAFQPTYNQRGLKALEMNDRGEVKLDLLRYALQEHRALGHEILFGYTPEVVANGQEVTALVEEEGVPVQPVHQVFARAREKMSG
ncbi:DevR family CRISPR-associated autoregulator [Desulfofundulus thermobenzoicus]|uniref:DevR family CRISPR-associated autoregulator n=1 Tax=Desulfofundulus thermobenzoicus TaxID=29376 RepID=A0A6N7IQ78_9FIRM|nr:DevR family CRISPR-associated autoregulator [Desulfofundulus thermobenzoicus]MQL52216.1 DevR family CRISPR-associated autoregulator [Desulfofundulus thermobenzoicus]